MENNEKPKARQEQLDAGDFLDVLPKSPKELPGAGNVEIIVRPPHARHCVVHIRQIHQDPLDLRDERTQREVEDSALNGDRRDQTLIQVQTDIFFILHRLSRIQKGLPLYLEGATRAPWSRVMPYNPLQATRWLKDKIEDRQKRVTLLKEELQTTKDERDRTFLTSYVRKIEEDIASLRTEMSTLEKQIDSGLKGTRDVLKLKNMYLQTTEDEKLNREAFEAMGDPEKRARAHERREDYVLQRIVANRHPVAIMVYGGAHNWKNNIEKWNKEHADQQFALIVITPKSYR